MRSELLKLNITSKCMPRSPIHFLLSLDLSLRISAVSVFPFDMEMCALILTLEDLPA